MSSLLTKIILAILLIPLSNSLSSLIGYLFTGSLYFRSTSGATWAVMLGKYLFVSGCWFLMWRPSVQWTRVRVQLTWLIFLFILLMGVTGYAAMRAFPLLMANAPVYIAYQTAVVTYLLTTTVLWRESKQERLERIKSYRTAPVVCPTCDYEMRGLHEARCPECGMTCTIDELFSAQPDREQELENA